MTENVTVVYAYDYGLTLPDEIAYIWMRKMTVTTILFLLNRYVVFAMLLEEVYLTFVDGRPKLTLDLAPGPAAWPAFINQGIRYFVCLSDS